MFAIKTLSTLLSFDSNDGVSSLGPENVLSNGNGGGDNDDCSIANKIEFENKSTASIESVGETEMISVTVKVSLDGKDDADDESTAAVSESSSSSHIYSTFERPIKEFIPQSPTKGNVDRNKDSVLLSYSQGEEDKNKEGARSVSKNGGDSLVVLGDVEEDQCMPMAVQDPSLTASEEKRGMGIEDLATPSTIDAIQEDEDNNGYDEEKEGKHDERFCKASEYPIADETEAIKGKEEECTDNEAEAGVLIDVKEKDKEVPAIAHVAKAEVVAKKRETEKKAPDDVLAHKMYSMLEAEAGSIAETHKEELLSIATENGTGAERVESKANAAGNKPEREDRVEGGEGMGCAAEEGSTVVVEPETPSLYEAKGGFKSRTIAMETPAQRAVNSTSTPMALIGMKEKKEGEGNTAIAISAKTKDGETPPLTLTQRMKEMFDSKSPDQPSNAFGKSNGMPLKSSLLDSGMTGNNEINSQKPASITKDMKTMFDSPSPVEPSRAFGAGKVIVHNLKQSTTRGVEQSKCDTDPVLTEESNAEPKKLASPVSVADQMVSLLWASTLEPTKKSPLSSIDPEYQAPAKQGTKENFFRESSLAVIRDNTIMEEEEEVIDDEDDIIEEITVDETVCPEDDYVMTCDESSEDEIIEEVIIDSLTTADDFTEIRSLVELSPDFVDTVEIGESDGRSYDEITADGWEYDEETVDDSNDADALQEDQDNDIESKKRFGEKEEINTNALVIVNNSCHRDADSSGKEPPEPLHLSISDTKKKLNFQTKRFVNPVQNEKGKASAISYLPAPSPAKETRASPTPTKIHDNHRKDSSTVGKLNPRLYRDRSSTVKIAEKLKMFNSPNGIAEGQKQSIAFQQLRREQKPRIESPPSERYKVATKVKGDNPDTAVVLPVDEPTAEQVDKLDEKPLNASGYTSQDEALVEEIISLVTEPGAMQNKHVLAERITSLLADKRKEIKVPTPNCSLHMVPSKLAELPSPTTNYAVEGNAYSGPPNHSPYSTPKKLFEGPSPKSKQAAVEVYGFSRRLNSSVLASPSKLIEDSSHKSKHAVEARSYLGRPNCSSYLTPKKLFEDPSPKSKQAVEAKSYPSRANLSVLSSSPSTLLKETSQKSKHAVEANASMNHRKDGFQDLGLKQIPTDVELQKGKLHHAEDPETIQNRQMKQINIKERKEEVAKPSSMKHDSDKTQEVVDTEAIIARIWPKTPDVGKQKPKVSRSSSRASKSVTFERTRPAPRKLGDKLKMFENTPSSSISPSKPPGTFEKDVRAKKNNAKTNSTTVAAQNGNNDENTKSNQISKQTVRMISSFQRLWRAGRKLKCKTTAQTEVGPPWKKEVVFSGKMIVFPDSPEGETSSSTGMRNQYIPRLSEQVDIPVPASCPDPEAIVPSKTGSSIDSDVVCCYSLEDFEQGRFDPSVVDMERWEEFLSDESFNQNFGLTRDDFYKQPKWKRDKQKRKVRNAF